MAMTPSNMLPLGTPMPAFMLSDPSGKVFSNQDVKGKYGTLVVFICNHCPYVVHIASGLTQVTNKLLGEGIGVVAINSNDAKRYPDDAPEKMVLEAKKQGYRFPYLYDADQRVAKAFDAACTPDFYLFDSKDKLFYRGQFDSSRPSNSVLVTGQDLLNAVSILLKGEPAPSQQRPSMGCNIKWLPGNEPGSSIAANTLRS